MAKNWIKGAIKHPGALHRQLGVKEGEKIPAKKMAAARAGKYGAKAEQRAHLAKTLGSFDTGGVVRKSGPYHLEAGEQVVPNAGEKASGPMTRDSEGNNCPLLQCGASPKDHAHVQSLSPNDIKRKELAMIPKEDRTIKSSTAARKEKDSVRPL